MYAFVAPTACAAMAMPSITMNGSFSRMYLSLKAPTSPSDALQMMYFLSPGDCAVCSHFSPVGKPPPPLPRSPDRFTSSITCAGVMPDCTRRSAPNPPRAKYEPASCGSINPQFLSTSDFCGNGLPSSPDLPVSSQYLCHLLRRETTKDIVIYHHRWALVAGTDAVDQLQRKQAILAGVSGCDIQFPFHGLYDRLVVLEIAGHAFAHSDDMLP